MRRELCEEVRGRNKECVGERKKGTVNKVTKEDIKSEKRDRERLTKGVRVV